MRLDELIKNNTKIVNDFKIRKEKSQKASDQRHLDENFRNAIDGVKGTIDLFQYAKEESDFLESSEELDNLNNLLLECKEIVNVEFVKASDTARINSMNKVAKEKLEDEWKDYYLAATSSIQETLGIVKNVTGSDINSLVNDIRNASELKNDRQTIRKMMKAIEKSNEVIDELELNETVITFLKKMINHTASLEDLNTDVEKWISKEGIKGKIKLSF